jgi:hypothetical protein
VLLVNIMQPLLADAHLLSYEYCSAGSSSSQLQPQCKASQITCSKAPFMTAQVPKTTGILRMQATASAGAHASVALLLRHEQRAGTHEAKTRQKEEHMQRGQRGIYKPLTEGPGGLDTQLCAQLCHGQSGRCCLHLPVSPAGQASRTSAQPLGRPPQRSGRGSQCH